MRNLSYGEQRQLEIGLALAGDPVLLLLDEPTSGMSPAETERMIALIAGLPRNLSILMIEHDMNVVFTIADRITVFYYGEVLASGPPDEIRADAACARSISGCELSMLELEGVNTYYGESHVLRGVSLSVRDGEVVCLLGRNGAGKTTTILTDDGLSQAALGPHPLSRARYRRAAALRDRAARRRLCAARARYFPEPHRAREPYRVRAERQAGAGPARIFELFPVLRSRGAISAFNFPAASSRCCRSRGR